MYNVSYHDRDDTWGMIQTFETLEDAIKQQQIAEYEEGLCAKVYIAEECQE